MASVIHLENLHKALAGRPILENTDLEVQAGETLAIIGPSGSGKTVLLHLLLGLWEPDQGRRRVEGRDWAGMTEEARRAWWARCGVVFQGSALFDWLTVRENVAFPLRQGATPAWETAIRTRTEELLRQVGLPESAWDARPAELSGGMQRRVALARALVAEPEVVFYDEPTSGLDAVTADQIGDLLQRFHRARAATSVLITHDYRLAARLADRVLFLNPATRRLEPAFTREELAARREVGPEEGEEALRRFLAERQAEVSPPMAAVRPSPTLGERLRAGVERLGEWVLLVGQVRWPQPWAHLFQRLGRLGLASLPLVGVSAFLVGLVLTLQARRGLEVIGMEDQIPGLLAKTLVREIAPLLTALLLAGRVGSSLSAEIGALQTTKQLDALRVLGLDLRRFLFAPLVWAALLATPLLILAADGLGLLGSYLIFREVVHGPHYGFLHGVKTALDSLDLLATLSKGGAFGLVLSVISYHYGTVPKKSAEEIGRATTQAVVTSSFLMILLDFLLTAVFYR